MPRQTYHRRTRIVCTLGPATGSPAMIERLVRAGMDVARLNLSHGDFPQHTQWVETVRRLSQRLGRNVAVLLDLPGPKYRIGKLPGGRVVLKNGARVTVTTRQVEGDANLLPVNLPNLSDDVRPGDTALLADGALRLKVESVEGTEIKCRVVVGGLLESGKGLVVPGMTGSTPFLTERLRESIDFAAAQQPDHLALSFVGKADDVTETRAILNNNGVDIPIISKIERVPAVRTFDSILEVSDGIMVARGDLGVEIALERVPLIQKEIIKKCNRAGKPVITATEMLESMTGAPRPTRAETTDVANAIFDGTDATMLSEETSVGKYPVPAVRMMGRIAVEAERFLPYDQILNDRGKWLRRETDELISYNACLTADSLNAAVIVAFTQSGSTAQRVSRYRPRTPILALTSSREVCRRLVLYWGVSGSTIDMPSSVDAMFRAGADSAKELGFARPGDLIVITGGVPVGVAGSTNMLKVEKVS